MEVLIGARAIQGLGVGGLTALVQVVIASMVSPRERGRYSGYIGADVRPRHGLRPAHRRRHRRHPRLGWRWCFFVGLPVAVARLRRAPEDPAPAGDQARGPHRLPRRHPARRRRLAAAGLGLARRQPVRLDLRHHRGCSSPRGLAVLAAAIYVEAQVALEPIIPLRLFKDRTTSLATAASVLIGVAMFGSTVYLSQYFQLARGMTPDARRPDVDRDGRRPAGLEHRERPDHHRDRPLEAVPGRRHGRSSSPA